NYFISDLFRDGKWWAKIVIGVIAAMNFADLLSAGIAYPGFFGLWIVRVTVVSGIIGLLAYYFYQNRVDDKERRLAALLPDFIAGRRVAFEKMIAADPKFQTFCYTCHHYDAGRTSCSLCLVGRTVKIKLHPQARFEYCLYWNLCDHPVMELTENMFAPARGN
ncbi:MAG TPA: hypothetical protein VLQ89_08405, partial [Candidatus Binatia bacterium]|nr:hypothetical protein [Candidatus Binatia bacterium]